MAIVSHVRCCRASPPGDDPQVARASTDSDAAIVMRLLPR
jgi:hypothetical protein